MADISSNTRSTPDIVQAQPGDQRVGLEQKGQGLSDPTASAEDGDFALGTGRGGEGSEGGGFEGGSGEHFGRRTWLSWSKRGLSKGGRSRYALDVDVDDVWDEGTAEFAGQTRNTVEGE